MFPKGITKLREAATGEYRNEFLEMNEAQNIINRDSCVKQALRFMASFKCNSIIEPSDEYRLVSYLLFMYNIIIQLCATDDAVESSINNAVIDDWNNIDNATVGAVIDDWNNIDNATVGAVIDDWNNIDNASVGAVIDDWNNIDNASVDGVIDDWNNIDNATVDGVIDDWNNNIDDVLLICYRLLK